MKNTLVQKVNEWPDVEEINPENKHLFDQEMQEVFELIETKTFEELFPNKHRAILESEEKQKQYVIEYTLDLLRKNPKIPYLEIVFGYMKNYGGFINSGVIAEKAKIIEEAFQSFKNEPSESE